MRNQPDLCEIDWDSMLTSKLYKSWLLEHCHQEGPEKQPRTLEQMANRWHDTKFCGYWDEGYIEALQEFCKHLKPYGSHPRLYYEYEGYDQLWCLEFIPGTGIVNWATYDYHKELKQIAPPYPEELESYEKYTDAIAELEDEYWGKHREVREALQEKLPDREGWKFQKLVHKNMSDEEALMHLWRMIHPSA